MKAAVEFFNKNGLYVQIVLLLVAFAFLSIHISIPLADYDEATYAKVTIDTLKTGDVFSLTLSGHSWFEKPPLYFWMAMGTVKIFGDQELAFRLPAILAAVICLWLVYLIVKELTGDTLSATVAFLVLLLSPLFYYFAREARLDQGVIMGILAALYFWIRGWSKETYLIWVFPALAVAFLFKSIIAFLFGPIVLVYCLFHQRWSMFTSKYLWIGFLPALIVLLPWHIVETLKYGSNFWNVYLIQQSIGRSVVRITGNTNGYSDYIQALWDFGALWLLSLVAVISIYVMLFFSKKWRSKISSRQVGAPLCVALVILILFSLARTHLEPYIMPAFPFMAIFVGMLYHRVSLTFHRRPYLAAFVVLPFIVTGIYHSFSPEFSVPHPHVLDEANTGKIYRKESGGTVPLYSFGAPYLETIHYYAGTTTLRIDPPTSSGKTIEGPFYAIASVVDAGFFFFMDTNQQIQSWYGQKLLYLGEDSILIYSPKDFMLP
jgi:4-amino-4-deoxy-L-arabinose transferase-like glycosyltransferase